MRYAVDFVTADVIGDHNTDHRYIIMFEQVSSFCRHIFPAEGPSKIFVDGCTVQCDVKHPFSDLPQYGLPVRRICYGQWRGGDRRNNGYHQHVFSIRDAMPKIYVRHASDIHTK